MTTTTDVSIAIPDVAEKWGGGINEVTIGATADSGGSRGSTVTIGGSKAVPFMSFEGSLGCKPAIAVEVWDIAPDALPPQLSEAYGDSLNSPGAWAKKAVEFGAELICLRLMGAHPDVADKSPDDCAAAVKEVLQAVDVPLIIWGCDVDEKDNQILPAVSSAANGENCLIGTAKEKNYRTLVAVCLADGHKLLAESPLDIN
ncbi:MAG: acetyl-CoA decarbonylase/synthase complex subunit delta, partial [Phycisphaerae bacterium]|nr:acetyl-CoA decarbonylase/synthase complex subunit delta [Phycisphaerae bacterium]